ncbi:DUF7674 family protein [Devosia sediminis]|uniref:DUF7674 domain-containing protein n=1 Tax=Devosia sediminis TaxID=2798801 RepID=A0A934MM84_9HYPH|nr:hypothetical protein [Devosia sediminis]MBJ3787053.1 hypothetical protein [Devosia sediminis]
MTIARKTMFEPLIETLPGFRPMREAFVEKWTGNAHNHFEAPGDLPEYLLLGDLARWLIDLLNAGSVEDVRSALVVVDRWLLEGDHYVQEAAMLGFIETLQNNIEDDQTRQRFFDLLGPEGQHWWKKLDRFWTKGEHLVDERKLPAEKQATWTISQVVNIPLWRAGRKRDGAEDE